MAVLKENSVMHSCLPTQHPSLLLWILSTLLSSAPRRVEGTHSPILVLHATLPCGDTASLLPPLGHPACPFPVHNSPASSQSFLLHCFILLFFFLCSVGGQIQGLVCVRLMFYRQATLKTGSHVTQADLKLCSRG